MNKKRIAVAVFLIFVMGMVSISGCTTQETCPQCGSSSLEVVENHTNNTTGKEMITCNCNNCGYTFLVEK